MCSAGCSDRQGEPLEADTAAGTAAVCGLPGAVVLPQAPVVYQAWGVHLWVNRGKFRSAACAMSKDFGQQIFMDFPGVRSWAATKDLLENGG